MIVVVDYDMGNLGSILNMLKKIGADALASHEPADIENADKLILPGVGAFDHGMKQLNNLGLVASLNRAVIERGIPLLGICLGAQLLTEGSEEGSQPGFGWFKARSLRFDNRGNRRMKIPHMGWNIANPVKSSSLFEGMPDPARFYFVHSYYMQCEEPSDRLTSTQYDREFTSAIERGNIAGVQFHPEKSHKYGTALMRNFAERFGDA